jgi:CHASE2 domain-containing sensor protein
MRELFALGYGFLTLIICANAMLRSSFSVGAEALLACVLNFAGLATLFTCFLARREKGYRKMYLIGAAAIALALVAAGFAVMMRTGFWIPFYDAAIPGPVWLLVGGVAALLWSMHRKARARW